jgi:hypothetical protein
VVADAAGSYVQLCGPVCEASLPVVRRRLQNVAAGRSGRHSRSSSRGSGDHAANSADGGSNNSSSPDATGRSSSRSGISRSSSCEDEDPPKGPTSSGTSSGGSRQQGQLPAVTAQAEPAAAGLRQEAVRSILLEQVLAAEVYTELFRAVTLQLQDLVAVLSCDVASLQQGPATKPPLLVLPAQPAGAGQQSDAAGQEDAAEQQQQSPAAEPSVAEQSAGALPSADTAASASASAAADARAPLTWSGVSSSLVSSITADRQQLMSRLGKLLKAVQQMRGDVVAGKPLKPAYFQGQGPAATALLSMMCELALGASCSMARVVRHLQTYVLCRQVRALLDACTSCARVQASAVLVCRHQLCSCAGISYARVQASAVLVCRHQLCSCARAHVWWKKERTAHACAKLCCHLLVCLTSKPFTPPRPTPPCAT